MKTELKRISTLSLLVLSVIIICGCANSPSPRLYLLRSDSAVINHVESAPLVILGPVEIAEYLNRPQIVLRKSRHEVAHAQFDRWAEPLDEQVKLYLKDSMANALKEFRVEPFPWRGEEAPLYDVSISIIKLDGTPGGKMELTADWVLKTSAKNGRILKDERTTLTTDCPEPGVPGIVAATEELLSRLSDILSSAVKQAK